MQNPSLENCYKQGAIVLETSQNVTEFISNLFQEDDPLSKFFQKNIWPYNLALAFILLKSPPDLRLLTRGVQNFLIYKELYYIQKHIHDELHDNHLPHYAQLYHYDLTFTIE